MVEKEWLVDALGESVCNVSDKLNGLLDEEFGNPERALSSIERALALRILEHIMTAEQLIEVLKEKIDAGK